MLFPITVFNHEVRAMSEEDSITAEFSSEDIEVGTGLVLPGQAMPRKLHLIPVTGRPFFPAQAQPLVVNKEPWHETLKQVNEADQKVIGLVYVEDDMPEDASPEHFSEIGCVARIHNVVAERGKAQFIAQGIQRFTVIRWLSRKPPYLVEVEYPDSPVENPEELRAYAMALITAIKELLPLNPLYSEELKAYLSNFSPNEPSLLADFAAAITSTPGWELQEILNTLPVLRRMEKVLLLIRKEIELASLQAEISETVNAKISDNQREFFLREQLKVIQKELGLSKDDRTSDVEEFEERMEALEAPDHVIKRFKDELHKLSILETGSPEYGVTRNYLDWMTSVPWGVHSKDKLNLKAARKVLDEHHAGLDDVKQRIIEFLAVGVFKGEVAGSILLLVGPPGVGKTSVGRSIADALGRKFYRFSVGGMRDEAEIKGHRRTYIGAMPGKFVQALKEVEVANPVIMLDEIDKIGASYQGDPASALLETLDPEQNSEFLDHYLDLRVDLSKVLFICTANQLDTIPGPLLDRMDMIRLSGYITDEKLAIAKQHLWPKVLEKTGLKSSQLKITDPALKQLIEDYAREAGVRNLEKLLNKIARKAVVKILDKPKSKISVSGKQLESYLGEPFFKKDRTIREVGVVTGLAWTAMGGCTLPVEATIVHRQSRGLRLTGQLGDVMKESADIAYSFLAGRLERYQCDNTFFDKAHVHVHVPEGATPKDGPSAGVTMATALLSLVKNKKINRSLAMTGELTLTGQVFPVGGIREKVIASKRLKIMELLLPEANSGDYNELPEYIKQGMKIHFVSHFDQVADIVFG